MAVTKEQVFASIKKAANDIADIAVDDIKEDSTLEALGLDSLDAVEIICNVEEELNIELDSDVLSPEMTLADIVEKVIQG